MATPMPPSTRIQMEFEAMPTMIAVTPSAPMAKAGSVLRSITHDHRLEGRNMKQDLPKFGPRQTKTTGTSRVGRLRDFQAAAVVLAGRCERPLRLGEQFVLLEGVRRVAGHAGPMPRAGHPLVEQLADPLDRLVRAAERRVLQDEGVAAVVEAAGRVRVAEGVGDRPGDGHRID